MFGMPLINIRSPSDVEHSGLCAGCRRLGLSARTASVEEYEQRARSCRDVISSSTRDGVGLWRRGLSLAWTGNIDL